MAQGSNEGARAPERIVVPDRGSAEPADVMIRFWARAVDAVLLVVLSMAAAGLAVALAGAGMEGAAWQIGLMLALLMLYEPGMTAWKGGTLGKLFVGLRAVDLQTGEWPRFGRSLLRAAVFFALTLSYLPGNWSLLGLATMAALAMAIGRHPHRRGWHDQAARTAVVLKDTLDQGSQRGDHS
ncbi:RDD family protein [Nesterenkonia populi]